MDKLTLYKFESENLSVHVEVYFEDGNLVVEGYDIGKVVKEALGDSDYEYSTTVSPDEADKLYPLFELSIGDKPALLQKIAERFNTNTCYSEFNAFLNIHGIKWKGFAWA